MGLILIFVFDIKTYMMVIAVVFGWLGFMNYLLLIFRTYLFVRRTVIQSIQVTGGDQTGR